MKPIRTARTNTALSAPSTWAEDSHCEGLPIAVSRNTMFSYWRPSLAERLAIAIGRPIRLGVFGASHPPVSIDTQH
jgi:hypothetical protein